jgi:hypothetical protein
MKSRNWWVCLVLVAGTAACTSSPIAPAGTVTVTAASAVAPANGAQIANASQPITLTVTNATVTDASVPVTYTFEVATDAAFTNKAVTKDVPQTGGQTSLKLDPLPGGKDYYWHVRTTAGDTVGAFSAALKFTIGAPIIINPPTATSPLSGSSSSGWPVLTVTNAQKSGPVGTTILYKFEVATSAGFDTIVVSGTVVEGTNQTTFTPTVAAPAQTTQYFWRATASDPASGIASAASSVQTFTFTVTAAGILWPGAQPPGTPGHAVKGDGWDTQTLVSFNGVVFTSPRLEILQMFDLLDRGFEPQAGIDWMHANGYATEAFNVPAINVIGFAYEYIALINGRWDLVIRNGA